ncbi:MAG: hypothetical protein CO140_03790, partial [Candidatus Moranbacteria bacterium CG_4_9_14_3_um_filter_40_7]
MNAGTAVSPRQYLTIKQGSWLILGLLALAIVFTPLPVGTAVATTRTLHLEASNFAFSPAVIEVN